MYPKGMSRAETVPYKKYRRLQMLMFSLLGVSIFLVIALFAQFTNQGASKPTNTAVRTATTAPTQPDYIRNDADDPMAIGDIDAPLVLVEWTDMRCPFCAVFSRDTLPEVVKEYVDSGQVRIEINDVSFFGEDSSAAAVAARAAGRQGKYAEFLTTVYANAPEDGHPDMPREKLLGFAKSAGVADLDQFESDIDDPTLAEEVAQSTTYAQQLGVNSVPFFVADGTALSGAQPIENFRQFLDSALANTQK